MPCRARASSMPRAMPSRCSASLSPTERRVVGRGGQLDVDRPLAGADAQVLVGDVAVVLGGADDARGAVVGAQEVEEVRAVKRSSSPSSRRARASPLRSAIRRISSGGAVPSRWTCSSALGTDRRPQDLDHGRRTRSGRIAHGDRARAARATAARRSPRRAAWTIASGPLARRRRARPGAATSVSPTAWSIASVSRARPPPRPMIATPTARTSTPSTRRAPPGTPRT